MGRSPLNQELQRGLKTGHCLRPSAEFFKHHRRRVPVRQLQFPNTLYRKSGSNCTLFLVVLVFFAKLP